MELESPWVIVIRGDVAGAPHSPTAYRLRGYGQWGSREEARAALDRMAATYGPCFYRGQGGADAEFAVAPIIPACAVGYGQLEVLAWDVAERVARIAIVESRTIPDAVKPVASAKVAEAVHRTMVMEAVEPEIAKLACEIVAMDGASAEELARGIVDLRVRLGAELARASKLGDRCGALSAENGELLKENAVLRRRLENAERAHRRVKR